MCNDIRKTNPVKYYGLYAKLGVFRKRIKFADDIIKEALVQNDQWAVAVSGGKDSTVMLDLCFEAGWRGALFHFRYKETPIENTALCISLAENYGLRLDIVDVPGAFDVFEEFGFFVSAGNAAQQFAVKQMLSDYKRIADEFTEEKKYQGLFIGMRKEESKVRAITISKYGMIYQTANRKTKTCCPIALFGGKDIWAYIFSRKLPYLSIYDKTDNREKQRSELTWLDTESLWRYGQGRKYKQMFPSQWNEYVKKWPELAVIL